MNYTEITKEAFNQLVSVDSVATSTKQLEHGFYTDYREHSVNLRKVDSYLAGVTQYYLMDINF